MAGAPGLCRLLVILALLAPALAVVVWAIHATDETASPPLASDYPSRHIAYVADDSGASVVAASPPRPLPTIDPFAPVAALLPTPSMLSRSPLYLGDNLARVPELALDATLAGRLSNEQWKGRKAHEVAVALHLNGREEDGFLKALLRTRPDLSGLPFVMGGACRTKGERAANFKSAAEKARTQKGALVREVPAPGMGEERRRFWQAHTAAAAQVLPGESVEDQHLHLRTLASIPRPEAARALARIAVFATEEAVRAAAVEALSVRRQGDYSAVLVEALRYPWPAVAINAAQAIVQLDRQDLSPHLVALRDAPDPRGPRTEEVGGVKAMVAPELVRINHLRNCLLCHAPAERANVPAETLLAEVPVPTEALPYYSEDRQPQSNLLVRVDVTYLRQDFSALLEVKETSAWPARQRFDFVVRKRVLTPAEADDLRARLAEGASPYRLAAEQALRTLALRQGKPS